MPENYDETANRFKRLTEKTAEPEAEKAKVKISQPKPDLDFNKLYDQLMKMHEKRENKHGLLSNLESPPGVGKTHYVGKLAIPVPTTKPDMKEVEIEGKKHYMSATEYHYLKMKMHAENYGMKQSQLEQILKAQDSEPMLKPEFQEQLRKKFHEGFFSSTKTDPNDKSFGIDAIEAIKQYMGHQENKQEIEKPLRFTVRVYDDKRMLGKIKISMDKRLEIWRDGKSRETPFEKMETAHLFFAVRMLYNMCAPSDHLCHKSYKGKKRYAPREEKRLVGLKVMERMMAIWATRDDVLDSQCDEMEFMVANVKKYY